MTTIPPEAIDAAVQAHISKWTGPVSELDLEYLRRDVTIALETAAPFLRASAALAAGTAIVRREERIAELEQLASDILATYHPTSDGHRGRVGQVQIAKWRKVLDGEK